MNTHEHNGMYTRKTIIVPADLAPTARAVAVELAGSAAAGMWEVALSADGCEPATHYVSAGMVEDTFVAPMTDAALMFELAQQLGAEVTAEQCEALVTAADVSGEEPFEVFARLGLQLISPAE